MENEKNQLILQIKMLSNLLDNQYNNELNFRNHCYLRIAYDNTVQDKWDNIITKPFIKYATIVQLQDAVGLLNKYSLDKSSLLSDNDKSLNFRSIFNTNEKEIDLKLF